MTPEPSDRDVRYVTSTTVHPTAIEASDRDVEAVNFVLRTHPHPTTSVTRASYAFARLTERLEAAEREREQQVSMTHERAGLLTRYQHRAEAAEQRVVELEKQLEDRFGRDFKAARRIVDLKRIKELERERDGERTRVRFLEQVVDTAEQRVRELEEALRSGLDPERWDEFLEIARAALREGGQS